MGSTIEILKPKTYSSVVQITIQKLHSIRSLLLGRHSNNYSSNGGLTAWGGRRKSSIPAISLDTLRGRRKENTQQCRRKEERLKQIVGSPNKSRETTAFFNYPLFLFRQLYFSNRYFLPPIIPQPEECISFTNEWERYRALLSFDPFALLSETAPRSPTDFDIRLCSFRS